MIKSPVLWNKEELQKWWDEDMATIRLGVAGFMPIPTIYPCMVVAHRGERMVSCAIVYYYEFQSARYKIVEEKSA